MLGQMRAVLGLPVLAGAVKTSDPLSASEDIRELA